MTATTALATQSRSHFDLTAFLAKMRTDVPANYWNALIQWVKQLVARIAKAFGVKVRPDDRTTASTADRETAGGWGGRSGTPRTDDPASSQHAVARPLDKADSSELSGAVSYGAATDIPASRRSAEAANLSKFERRTPAGGETSAAAPAAVAATREAMVAEPASLAPTDEDGIDFDRPPELLTFTDGTPEAIHAAHQAFQAQMDTMLAEPWAFSESPSDRSGVLRMLSMAVEKAEICRLAHLASMEHAQSMAEVLRQQQVVAHNPTVSQVFREVGEAPRLDDDSDSADGQLRLMIETTRKFAVRFHTCVAAANALTTALPDPVDQPVLRAAVEEASQRAAQNFGLPGVPDNHSSLSPLPEVADLLAVYVNHAAEVLEHDDHEEDVRADSFGGTCL